MKTRFTTGQHGFTLIEAMLTVSIIGILAAIAYPNYTTHTQKARRSVATAQILQSVQQLEKCFTINTTYELASCPAVPASYNTPEGYYTITVDPRTATSYTVIATARTTGGQAGDTHCRKFTLDNLGTRSAYDSGNAQQSDCWSS